MTGGGNAVGTFNVALLYEIGEVVQKNTQHAIDLCRKAEQLGHPNAGTSLPDQQGRGAIDTKF